MPRKVIYYIVSLWLALSLIVILKEFWVTAKWMALHLKPYRWFLMGAGAFVLVRLIPAMRKNEEWLQVFSHELSHTVVGLLFFQRIHSFEANNQEGAVTHSGHTFGKTFISLAPYTLPVFTFLFLLFRIMATGNSLYIFDLCAGFTLAFHLLCFAKQTRPYQTDISTVGYLKSYLYIICTLVFNLTIILLSIRMGIVNANAILFRDYWHGLLSMIKFILP